MESLNSKIRKIQKLEAAYVVFGRVTRMPFLMCDKETYNDQVRLYDTKDEAIEYCNELKKETKDLLLVAEIHNSQMLNFFGSLFFMDVDEIAFKEKGYDEVVVPLEKIVIKPDFYKYPAVNTNLQLTGLYFMQELARSIPNEEKEELPRLEEEMSVNVVRGKFIVPVLLDHVEVDVKEAQVMLPRIANNEGKQFQPLFTDVNEFAKFNKDKQYKLNVMDFDTILKILDSSVEGVAINPLGMNIILSKETLNIIKIRYENE